MSFYKRFSLCLVTSYRLDDWTFARSSRIGIAAHGGEAADVCPAAGNPGSVAPPL